MSHHETSDDLGAVLVFSLSKSKPFDREVRSPIHSDTTVWPEHTRSAANGHFDLLGF